MSYDVIIIGSGPAGMTAGIYLGRYKRKVLIVEGPLPGGQLTTTDDVENWPGDIIVKGPALMKQMKEQATKAECEFVSDEVVKVDFANKPYKVFTKNNQTFESNLIIIATGASPKKLGCPGEDEYWGKGVNVCATCDAPLYKNREVVVIGGGDVGVVETYALSKHAKKVTVIQVAEELTAKDPLKDKILKIDNVDIIYNTEVKEIKGNGEKVTHIIIENNKTKETSEFKTDGVFLAIGHAPNSQIFDGQAKIDDKGYIVKNENFMTSVDGVFVSGDVTDKKYRQAITASGEGCKASLECEKILRK